MSWVGTPGLPVPDTAPDPYTVRHGEAHAPPPTLRDRLKYLGPSLIVTGAVIGTGELVLTTSLGAVAGWTLLWWILLSCWCKSLVQAELARYTIVSGDTYMRAMNRIPGRIGPVSWTIWVALLAYLPGIMGMGGIIGGAGESLTFLASLASVSINPKLATGIIAVACSLILSSGSYKWLERLMLVLVVTFTLTTLICSIAMQFTEYRAVPAEVIGGLAPDWGLFVAFASLALAAYGYTGTTSGDITAYTYWCIEKGYPSFLGSDRSDPDWESHARGWMKVLYTDVLLALVVVTCATIPYYVLGAGVLNKMGLEPEGSDETISVLSNIFTQTLGGWAVWVFSIGAVFILFSTVLSGIGAGGRSIPDYLIELRVFDRSRIGTRRAVTRWYVAVLPIVAFLIYVFSPGFVFLIKVGGLTSAIKLPIQSGATLWLQARNMDPRIRPRKPAYLGLWAIFFFQVLMAVFVVWFVVLGQGGS